MGAVAHQHKLWFLLFLVWVTFVVTLRGCVPEPVAAKGLFWLTTIEDLPAHNYENVAVVGWVQSVTQRQGTRGGDYLEILVRSHGHTVTVFTTFPVWVENSKVTVLGQYRKQGRFGSFLVENYINTSSIHKEW